MDIGPQQRVIVVEPLATPSGHPVPITGPAATPDRLAAAVEATPPPVGGGHTSEEA